MEICTYLCLLSWFVNFKTGEKKFGKMPHCTVLMGSPKSQIKNNIEREKTQNDYSNVPCQWCRKVKNFGGARLPVVIGGDNLPSPVGIGLSNLPNIGRASGIFDQNSKKWLLEPVCCKKLQKKVTTKKLVGNHPSFLIDLKSKGHLHHYKLQMSMSDPFNHLESIWYHSEPLKNPYSPNQFLGWDFLCRFLQQIGSWSCY
jgi:hypothetical protein